jgi:hypothetical protein
MYMSIEMVLLSLRCNFHFDALIKCLISEKNKKHIHVGTHACDTRAHTHTIYLLHHTPTQTRTHTRPHTHTHNVSASHFNWYTYIFHKKSWKWGLLRYDGNCFMKISMTMRYSTHANHSKLGKISHDPTFHIIPCYHIQKFEFLSSNKFQK